MHVSSVLSCFHGCLAFSTGMSHHNLLPHVPSVHLYTVNNNPRPRIMPHSPNSSSQQLHLPGNPVWHMYGCSKDCLILSPFRLLEISCFTLSLKCFSSDSNNCPDVGIGSLLQFPHLPRAGPVLLTLLFPPQLLCPTEFYMVLYILFHW